MLKVRNWRDGPYGASSASGLWPIRPCSTCSVGSSRLWFIRTREELRVVRMSSRFRPRYVAHRAGRAAVASVSVAGSTTVLKGRADGATAARRHGAGKALRERSCRTRASGRGTSAVSPSGEVNAPDNCAGVIECVTPRDSAVGDLAMRATGGPGRALRRYRCAGVHHDGRFRARFRRHLPARRAGIGVPSCACHSQGLLQQTVVTYPSHSG